MDQSIFNIQYSQQVVDQSIIPSLLLLIIIMDQEWQTERASTKTHVHVHKKKGRAFVGNLSPRDNLESKLRQLFSDSNLHIQSMEIKHPNASCGRTKCFALVECNDVAEAIKCLHGVQFNGDVISVQKEKKNIGNKNNNGRNLGAMTSSFGGGWSKPSGIGMRHAKPKKAVDAVASRIGKSQAETLRSNLVDNVVENSDHHHQSSTNKIITDTNDDDEIKNFLSRCNLNISSLMEEYGEHDPDYQNMKVDVLSPSQGTGSTPTATNNNAKHDKNIHQNNNQNKNNNNNSMLAPNDTAPIEISIVSFGYKYSVPPQARQGWSYSNPMPPMDCRDLPRCPHFVSKLSGLSFKVKKVMTSHYDYGQPRKDQNDDNFNKSSNGTDNNNNSNDIGVDGNECNDTSKTQANQTTTTTTNPLTTKCVDISNTIFTSIQDAINIGQHGFAFPLKTTIFIGSEYGRHRSVVLCEKVAQKIRTLLRGNNDDCITVPVSVSTRHRDIDNKHQDGEAFGDDLRREYEIEVKRKKRQEWLENQHQHQY